MTQTVLVLGASGRFGRNAAEAFTAAGWQVLRFDRKKDDLDASAQSADVIVNGWNPPSYSTWAKDLLAMHHRVIAAAKAAGTTVIVPGNVYVFGADTPMPWCENSAHAADNSLGRLRIEMEAAYKASGVRTILLRGGDFLDTQASENWFDKVMVTRLHKGVFTYPGDLQTRHAWAYLPDMARAAVALAERRADLPVFADVPFEGYTLTAQQMARTLAKVTGQDVKAKRMAWWPLRLLALVMPSLRGLPEMRYLWDVPHALDGARLKALVPEFVSTPVEEALGRAVRSEGT